MLIGINFSETFGPIACAVKPRVEIQCGLGVALRMSSFAAFLLLQDIEVLSLQVQCITMFRRWLGMFYPLAQYTVLPVLQGKG